MRIKLNQNEIIEAQKIRKIDDNKELITQILPKGYKFVSIHIL